MIVEEVSSEPRLAGADWVPGVRIGVWKRGATVVTHQNLADKSCHKVLPPDHQPGYSYK